MLACLFYKFVVESIQNSYLAFAQTIAAKFQSFKVSRIRDACFTASLFQGFITHNCSSKIGELSEGLRGTSTP